MLKEKISSVRASLGELLDKPLDEGSLSIIRACRENLGSAAEQAGEMETKLLVPQGCREVA